MPRKATSTKTAKTPPPDPAESAKSSGSADYAGDLSPESTQDELAAGELVGDQELGPGMDPAEDLRTRVRSLWLGLGGTMEVMLGPEMHHEPRDIDTLTAATIPLAEAFGMEWLGNWVHVIGLAGAVAVVELPKLRAVQARKAAREIVAADPATPTRPEYDPVDEEGRRNRSPSREEA